MHRPGLISLGIAVLLCGLTFLAPTWGQKGGVPVPVPLEVSCAAAALSPDGKWLLTEYYVDERNRNRMPPSWRKVTLWEVATGKVVKTFPEEYRGIGQSLLAFLPDGKRVLSAARSWWRVFEVPGGKVLREFKGERSIFDPLDVSRDAKRLLTNGPASMGRGMELWDIEAGKLIHRYDTNYAIEHGRLSPDGGFALVGGGPRGVSIQLWDFNRGKPVLPLRTEGRNWWGRPMAFSPDGKRFAAIQWGASKPVCLGDVESQKLVRRTAVQLWSRTLVGLAFTPDGEHLLLAGGGQLKRVALADGKEDWSLDIPISAYQVVFSADGAVALVANGALGSGPEGPMTFTLYDTVRGKKLRELKDLE